MSMLSSMCDKMRETADKVERFERRNSDWLWREASTITRAVVELRDAADTIDYLRNTCNDLQVENAKLKDLVWDMVAYGEDAGGGLGDWFADRLRELGIEV